MTLPNSPLFPRIAVLVIFGLLPAFVVAQRRVAPTPTATPPQIPTFSVKGRVVFDDSDKPVRRTQISLFQMPSSRTAERSSVTDRDGQFLIEDVPSGVYFAMVNAPGIISPLAFMSTSDRNSSENFDLKSIREYCTEIIVDSSDVKVTVHARRGGAISGKITYSDGEPAVDVQVAVIRRAGKKSERVLTGLNFAALMSLRTDDRGWYRIAGIPPGDYIVSASEAHTSRNTRRGSDAFFAGLFGSDSLLVTYYGGGGKSDDAIKLDVTGGSEASGIDITLLDATPHTVRGSVIAKLDRVPLPGATLSVRVAEQPTWFGSEGQQITTDSQGIWVLDGVPDGTYILAVEPPSSFPLAGADAEPDVIGDDDDGEPPRKTVPTRKFVPNNLEITVAGGDLVVEPIALAEGASISGTVEWPAKTDEDSRPYIQIMWRLEGDPNGSYGNSTGSVGDAFMIEGIRAGKVYLNANPGYGGYPDNDLYVKSITLNGVDLRQKPLTIAEGQSIRNVRIVIAQNPGKGSVKLTDGQGKPLSAKRVAIVPVDEGRWLFGNDTVVGTTDIAGMFAFTDAPGEYLVIVAAADDMLPPSPDVIRQRGPAATHLKLVSGNNQPVTIVVP